MDKNALMNNNDTATESYEFTDTTPNATLPFKKKKSMPKGVKIALIIVSIVLVLAILGGLAIGTILCCFGIVIAAIVYITMPKNDGTLEYRIVDGTISIWGLVDSDFEGALYIPEYIDGKAVTEIASYAFDECDNITEVYIPSTVKKIGRGAFEYCYSLKTVELGESVETIEDWAFLKCTSIESIVIPDSINYIGYSAFELCTSLTSVDMGDSVTHIDDYAFANCYELENVKLSPSLEEIGAFAFGECTSIEQITIPKNVSFIGRGAFYLCTPSAIYFENEVDNWSACPYYDKDMESGEKIIFSYELSPENAVWLLTDKYVEYQWNRLVQTAY